jgi:amidohydrolase
MSWLEEAKNHQDYIISLRRDFHIHPELGFEEVRSSGIIQQELTKLRIPLKIGIAQTGVVGIIKGERPGKTVLLRFDMDALALQEETGVAYQSQTPGKMHACGHDGHMAIGLGVANLLAGKKSELPGTIKLIFQPAEEGAGGAERMIAEGILDSPKPDFALGIHIWNEKPLGWLGITPGAVMAGADFFEIRIEGRGGHGAIPEKTADPIVTSAMTINALQSVISRNVSPRDCGVVSITQVRGGETYNVIPGSVELKGTIRSFQKDVHDLLVSRIQDISNSVAGSMQCEAKITWIMSDPPLMNDPFVTRLVFDATKRTLPNHSIDQNYQSMGSEDMALIQEKIPGCYIYIGSANAEKGLNFGHHHPKFNFDEIVLSQAAALICASAIELLNQA